jgi:hypothetical protein
MAPSSVETVVDAYLDAWNERDPQRRITLLGAALADDCALEGPTGTFTGLEAVDRLIVALQERMGDAAITRAGPVAAGTFGWEVRRGDGTVLMQGRDEVDQGDDGRLRVIRVVL